MSPIEDQILAYLDQNPDASDTLEGIAEWWLPGAFRPISIDQVRQALEALVTAGLLSTLVDSSGRAHYCLYNKPENRSTDTKPREHENN